jgi:osmotically-inducible protein OsmY
MSKITAGRSRWFLIMSLALFLAPGVASANETGPELAPPSASDAPTLRDLQVLLRVRRALMADDVLAPMNVGVIVRDGVATLWGPLTSPDEIRRALKEVGDVRGVQSVRNELYVAKDARPLPPVFVLPDRMTPDRAAPTDALASAPGQPSALTARAKPPVNDVGHQTLPAPGMAVLLTPIPLDGGHEEPTTVTAARTESVPAVIERLQKSDARFGQIGVEFNDGTIRLRGNRTDAAALMTFARLLSDVPGVERVVLQNSTKPRP